MTSDSLIRSSQQSSGAALHCHTCSAKRIGKTYSKCHRHLLGRRHLLGHRHLLGSHQWLRPPKPSRKRRAPTTKLCRPIASALIRHVHLCLHLARRLSGRRFFTMMLTSCQSGTFVTPGLNKGYPRGQVHWRGMSMTPATAHHPWSSYIL